MIKIDNLSFLYGEDEVFSDFSLNLERGKFYALLGKNGSGKSTLVKLILGIEKIDEKVIFVDKKDITDNIFEIRKDIGMVFQNPDNQIVTDIIEEEIAFSLENYGYSSEFIQKRVDVLLDKIDFIGRNNEKIYEISGGEKQRLCIASSLALNPKILILDEATAMLDLINREKVLKILKELQSLGMTIILITHYLNEIQICEKVIYLENKKLKFLGDVDEFKSKLIKEEIGKTLDLPPMFKVAKNIFKYKNIDVSKDIFDLKKMGEHLWKSL